MDTGLKKRRVLLNAFASGLQVVVTGAVLFFLYRYLLNTIGVERFGIWSVVLSTTSVANLANLGFSASVVKFVSKYLSKGEDRAVADLIQTSIVSAGTLVGLILLLAYPFASWFLGLIISAGNLKEALSILPYALVSLWMLVVAGVAMAGLDGYQRIDIRSNILVLSALFNLALCFVLVPKYGLVGLAIAHVAQSALVLLTSWIMLRRSLSLLPFFPKKWDRKLFWEMAGYGLNFQVIPISQMFCDPVTKALLTKFGGLAMVGYYEMANRMLLQFRMLLVSANQVLLPVIAELHEKNSGLIRKIYIDSYGIMIYLTLPAYAVFVAFTPVISAVWIGRYEPIFALFSVLLTGSFFINTLGIPAYFSGLGIGRLKWITLGHVATAVMNAVLGLAFGHILGGIGVVIAWIISWMTGTAMFVVSHHFAQKIPLKELLPSESVWLAAACSAFAIVSFFICPKANCNVTAGVFGQILILLLLVLIPFWNHPMRKRLTGLIISNLFHVKETV